MKITRFTQGLVAGLVGLGALVVPASIGTAAADVASTVVFKQNTDGHDCYRIPTVVKANNGELLAFAEARNGGASFCNDLGEIDLVVKRSGDNGKTWSAQDTVIKANGDTKDNPAPIVIPGSNRIVLLSTMQCFTSPSCGRIPRVSISEDNGKTWGAPRVLTTELGFATAPGWLATGPSHGIVLTKGAHPGRIVAGTSWSIGDKDTGALIYSDNNGDTWHRGAADTSTTTALNPQEISVTELADGRVYAAARNAANNNDKCVADGTHNRAYAISSDGGGTFSQKFTFETSLIAPPVEGSTARMSVGGAAGKYDRMLFAAPSICDHRKELRVHSSFDEGGSWTSNDASLLVWGQDAAYSDMVQLSTTSVGVLYEAGPTGNANETIRFSTVTDTSLGAPACGDDYDVIDKQELGTAGTVFLSYNASNGQNCVSTMKSAGAGTASQTSAYLEVQGSARSTDSGSFSYFAGPVKATAANKCVRWGGAVGSLSYNSEFEHCG